MALGASVAVATDPTISYNNDGGSNGVINPDPQSSWQWVAKSSVSVGSERGEFFQLQDGSGNAIKNLTLVFDKLSSPSNTPTQGVSSSTDKTLTITGNGQVNANEAVFTISNKGSVGKGILLGASGDDRGTLTFDFLGSQGASTDANWNGATDALKRKIVLNFADSTTLSGGEKVSLVGNILIRAGMGIANPFNTSDPYPNQTYKNTNEFQATFGDDVIGNITISPSNIKNPNINNPTTGKPHTSNLAGYRDIKSTFIFTAGSLNGDILSEAGENTFTFSGSNVKIDGNITAHNGYYLTDKTYGAGSMNEFAGGINTITFTHMGTITGNITANNAGKNKITFQENGTILGQIVSGDAQSAGNIIRTGNVSHNNLIVFNGTSATIGASSSTQASIIVNNKITAEPNTGLGRFSNNTVVFNSVTNKIWLNQIVTKGEFAGYFEIVPERQNLNILSFNNTATTTTFSVGTIDSNKGALLIGKNLYSGGNYSSKLFSVDQSFNGNGNYKRQGIILKDTATTEFLKTDYRASGNFTFGDINASYSGANFINVSGATSITGDIVSEGKNNDLKNHNNILVLSGTSATLGASGTEISIKIENYGRAQGAGIGFAAASNNTILLNATTNTLYIDELSAKGDLTTKRSFNALSFNSGTTTMNATTITASTNGYNIIGKDLVTQDNGYSEELFLTNKNTITMQDDFTDAFMNATYKAEGTYNFATVETGTQGTNYINVSNLVLSGTTDSRILSQEGGRNYIYAPSITSNSNPAYIVAQFGGSQNIITADTISGSGYIYARSGGSKNTITLKGNSTINLGGFDVISRLQGFNEITTTSNTSTLQLKSLYVGLPADDEAYAVDAGNTLNIAGDLTVGAGIGTRSPHAINAKNEITLSKEGAILTITDKGLTTRKSTFPSESNIQQNIITFSKGGTLTLNGSGAVSDDVLTTIPTGKPLAGSSVISSTTTFDFGGILARDHNQNTITFNSNNNATISVANSKILAKNYGVNNFVFNGTGTNTIEANMDIENNGKNNITLGNGGVNLILKGKTAGTSHEISSLTATTSGTNTLTLNNSTATNQAMTTKIHSVINGENLAVVLKGQTSKGVTLTLDNANGTTLKSVELHTDATTDNKLAFSAGSNKIFSAISVGANQGLTLDLSGANTSLNLISFGKSGNGEAKIQASGGSSTLNGGAIEATNLTFAGASTLTINNSSASFTNISVNAGSSTLAGIALSGSSNLTLANNTSLTLNNAGDSFALVDTTSASGLNGATLTIGGNLDASIAKLAGNNLIVDFNRQGGGSGKLSILDDSDNAQDLKSITLKRVSVTSGTNNTLDLSSLKTVQISDGVNVSANQELVFKLKDTSLSFANNSPSGGITKITVADTTSGATIAGATVSASELEMSGANAKVIFTATQTTLGTLDAKASGKNELVIGDSGTASLIIGTTNSTLDSVSLEGTSATLQLNKGASLTINTLNTNATANNLILNGSTLSLGSSSTINSLTATDNAVINLAVGHIGSNVASKAGQSKSDAPVRNKLTITTLSGNLSANVFVSKNLTDQIVINNATQSDTLTLYARGNAGEIISITSDDNVLVADTSGGTAKGKLVAEGGISDIGGLVIKLNVKEKNQGSGLWYVGETIVKGVDTSFQEVASSALAVNYNLYLANFNSLNKRMGELRDNPHSQGVWARVFGGAMSNDIGSGSKTQYVTAQAGYDYSLTLGDARNYMGIAVAYGSSWTKANEGVGLSNAFLDNINSQMAEVDIYNSYVMDNGWYNDTIFKFDYIMSDFDITASGNTSSHSTNNFAMILSDEFGYRYKFAESAKGNWYIDPQVEVAFGYFNQSDFNQAIAGGFTTVESSQDAILTLRTRAGLSLGKKFNTAKGFATLYVGAFYEYDYIEGGNAQTQTLGVTNTLDRLESNGRAIVNIGSNIELTEGVRMYIDVKKSFGDKQRTDMQFNFGARYSFGEKTPTISYQEQQKRRGAPLKVEDK